MYQKVPIEEFMDLKGVSLSAALEAVKATPVRLGCSAPMWWRKTNV